MIIIADKFTQTGRHILFKLSGSRLHELYTYVDDVMEYKVWYPEQPSNEVLQEEVTKQFAEWDTKLCQELGLIRWRALFLVIILEI